MEIKGKIIQNLGLATGVSKNNNEWKKASLVIETEESYPKKILISNFRDADEFVALTVGAKGTFRVDIESREWKNPTSGKVTWFTEVSCYDWSMEQPAATPQQAYAQQPQQSYSQQYGQPAAYSQQGYAPNPALQPQQSYEQQPYVQQSQQSGAGRDDLPF